MRAAFLIAVFCLASASMAQVKMNVILSGKSVGTATLTQKLLKDGGKQVQLSLDMKVEQTQMTLKTESTFDSKGRPIRKFQEMTMPAQKIKRQRIVTFDADGANLVETLNGERKVRKIEVAKAAPREDTAEFWFLRDQPKSGATSKVYVFNMDTLEWESVATTYKGTKDITVGGKKVKAHYTESTKGKAYLDEQGYPVRLELPNGALERIWG